MGLWGVLLSKSLLWSTRAWEHTRSLLEAPEGPFQSFCSLNPQALCSGRGSQKLTLWSIGLGTSLDSVLETPSGLSQAIPASTLESCARGGALTQCSQRGPDVLRWQITGVICAWFFFKLSAGCVHELLPRFERAKATNARIPGRKTRASKPRWFSQAIPASTLESCARGGALTQCSQRGSGCLTGVIWVWFCCKLSAGCVHELLPRFERAKATNARIPGRKTRASKPHWFACLGINATQARIQRAASTSFCRGLSGQRLPNARVQA